MRLFLLMVASTAFLLAVDPADGVREAAEGWRQGAIKQDEAALQRFLADELVYTHGNGKRQTKAEYIADVMMGPPHYENRSLQAVQTSASTERLRFSRAWWM